MITGNSAEIYEFKQTIVKELIKSDTIVEGIHGLNDDGSQMTGDQLPYKYILPYGFIPSMLDETGCYITVEVGMPNISVVNDVYKDVIIILTIISHRDMMRTDYGMTRVDYLAIEIDKLLNQRDHIGTTSLKLRSNIEGYVDPVHPCRTMKFGASSILRNKYGQGKI